MPARIRGSSMSGPVYATKGRTMSTAVGSRQRTAASGEAHGGEQLADVFVIFGITGDLAKVMTFHSLYRLEQRGLLELPDHRRRGQRLVGRRSAQPRARGDHELRRRDRRDRVRSPRGADVVRERRLRRRRNVRAARARDRRCAVPGVLPRDPAVPVRPRDQGADRGGADQDRARRGREAVRPRPRFGPGARAGDPPVHRRVAAVPDRPLPGEDGCGRDPLPAVRQRDVRADLEPQLRLAACRSRWPRASASRTAVTSTIRSARCATWSSTT